jgi:hypothetical protein
MSGETADPLLSELFTPDSVLSRTQLFRGNLSPLVAPPALRNDLGTLGK